MICKGFKKAGNFLIKYSCIRSTIMYNKSMKEESKNYASIIDKNYALATKLSNRGAGLFLVGMVLTVLLPGPSIGGLTLISSFFLGVIACCLGISAKNTRAIIVGAVPAILVIVFMIIGSIAEYNGVVVE